MIDTIAASTILYCLCVCLLYLIDLNNRLTLTLRIAVFPRVISRRYHATVLSFFLLSSR